MKIAVASDDKVVSEHFGFCENFKIFYVEEDEIVKREIVENPGHKPGFLPNFLHDMAVDVIISGGMGGGAVKIFNEKGIKTVIGAIGDVEDAVKRYISGELKSTGVACN